MATNIVLKRSSTSGAVPSTSDLALGEIAINTYDGKMYTKKTVSGSSSIVELTGNVALSSSAFDLINYKFTATSNQTSFSGSDANSNTLAYASGTIQVFLNGILLDPTDYTATNGTHVVLDTGANSGDILYISRFAGVNPFDDFKYVASSNQTSFSGDDANSNSLIYTVGNLAVYLNGVLLDPTDYTATTGTSVVLASGANSGDILHIHEFNQTGLTEVHADSSPTLGGDLDMHTFDLVTTDNRNIDIIPHGTGDVNLSTDTVKIGASGENVIVTTNGTGDITLSTNAGTNSGTVKILDGANQNIEITPNGSGKINLDGLLWPNADGSANQFIQTDGSGNLSFVDVLDTSEEIQDTVGAMFSSNTETGITATYQDADGTIDLVLDAAQPTVTSLGTLTSLGVNSGTTNTVATFTSTDAGANITLTDNSNRSTIEQNTADLIIHSDPDGSTGSSQIKFMIDGGTKAILTAAGELSTTSLDISGDVDVDGTLEADAITVNGTTLTEEIQDTVGAMFSSNTETNISATYEDSDGTIDLVVPNTLSNVTELGTLTHLDVDNININGNTIKSSNSDGDIIFGGNDGGSAITALTLDMSAAGAATFNDKITAVGTSVFTNLDISGDVDIDGTLEADAITVNGTTLSETIADTVGAMVSSNTESGITVAYQDADNTLDFTVGTLNQDTTGNAATATALETARTIHGVSFDGTANIDLTEVVQDTVGAMVSSNTESGITVTYQDADGTLDFTIGTLNQNTTGTAATVTTAAQPNITSLGTLTTLTVDDITLNGSTISDGADLTLDVGGNIVLDADGGGVYFKDAGTTIGFFQNDSSDFRMISSVSDKDIKFLGNDGGSTITALTLDMSASGNALFNSDVRVNDNKGVRLGNSQDFALVFDGTNSNVTAAGDLTLDVAGNIVLDAATGYVKLLDGGTEYGRLYESSNRLVIQSMVNNADLLFSGVDGGSGFTALTLDMSEAGHAIFNSSVNVTTHARGTLTTDNDGSFDMNASNNFKCTPSGNFTLTFTNISAQSGNILLINSGGHTVSAHANTKVDANILGTISTAGTYLLAYFSDGTNVYMTNSADYS